MTEVVKWMWSEGQIAHRVLWNLNAHNILHHPTVLSSHYNYRVDNSRLIANPRPTTNDILRPISALKIIGNLAVDAGTSGALFPC